MDLLELSDTFKQFPTFGALVTVIVRNAFVLAGVMSFLILVLGGFRVIMGAGDGDTKEIDKGKQAITGAVAGLIIVVTSYWIVQVLGKITGQQLLGP